MHAGGLVRDEQLRPDLPVGHALPTSAFHLPRHLHGRAQLLTNANLITAPATPTITAGAVTVASHVAVTVQ